MLWFLQYHERTALKNQQFRDKNGDDVNETCKSYSEVIHFSKRRQYASQNELTVGKFSSNQLSLLIG